MLVSDEGLAEPVRLHLRGSHEVEREISALNAFDDPFIFDINVSRSGRFKRIESGEASVVAVCVNKQGFRLGCAGVSKQGVDLQEA